MEFLNPGIWWGALALTIPIAVHFWNQKRGKVLPWAASRWLNNAVRASTRGLRLQELLLLLLRCLALLLLILYLSGPRWPWAFRKGQVHLVQPRKEVVEQFRFELENALQRGDRCYWFTGDRIEDLHTLPSMTNADVQLAINKINEGSDYEIYLENRNTFSPFDNVFVPGAFRLHISKAMHETKTVLPRYELSVWIESEQAVVAAALKALKEVHDLQFVIDTAKRKGKRYDLAFTTDPDTLARVNFLFDAGESTALLRTDAPRAVWLNSSLNPYLSDMVFNGELPEVILEALASYRGGVPLSQQQMEARFFQRKPVQQVDQKALLGLLVLLLCAERIMASYKNG